MQSALNLLRRPALTQQVGDDDEDCRVGLQLARASRLAQPLPGLTTGDVPQAKPLVGHLHHAGAFFCAKLVVV